MSKSYKINKIYKGEIDGFWLFIILLFIAVPLAKEVIKKFPGGSNDGLGTEAPISVTVTTSEDTTNDIAVAPVAPKGSANTIYLDEEISTHSTGISKGVKFRVGENVAKAVIKSPDGTELRAEVKNGSISTVFNKEGLWEITIYDKNGFSIGWHKINVF